jgi:hypothetical protein
MASQGALCRATRSVLFVHWFSLGPATLLVLDPCHKVINDRRPRRLFGPEAHFFVDECELRELQCLVPHVFVDALLVRSGEEFFPPVQPRCASARPLDCRQRGAEEEVPEGNGLFEGSLL